MKHIFFFNQDLLGDVQNLHEYFRAMYKKVILFRHDNFPQINSTFAFGLQFIVILLVQVTEADIEEFEANYRGSDSEKKDLIGLYKKCKGKMKR